MCSWKVLQTTDPGYNLGISHSYKQLSHMCAAAVPSLIAPLIPPECNATLKGRAQRWSSMQTIQSCYQMRRVAVQLLPDV